MPTAEEAAAANLAWRAVNAPETVTSSEQPQAQQYAQQYWNVERPQQEARDAAVQQTIYANRQMINRQEGLSYGGTHTLPQLAALYGSAERGRAAYASEDEYYDANPSSNFQNLTNQYAASRNMMVGSQGAYAATGQLALNTTAGEGGFTGRAATYKAAYDREVYGIGAPDNEVEYYRRNALEAATERPGFTAPTTLGDTQTRQARAGYSMFSQAMGLTGDSVASDYQFTGQMLEYQRQAAYATPTRRDETFYMNEIQKWAQAPVEQASAYHHIGMDSGVPIPANPFEYQADLAVEFLKGAPQKSSEFFSPVSGEMSKSLPGGEGIQQFAWREAVAVDRGARRQDMPGQVSFMAAITKLGQATGQYGPYGRLYGGPEYPGSEWTPAKATEFPASQITWSGEEMKGAGEGRLVGSKMLASSPTYGGTGNGELPAPFRSTSSPATQTESVSKIGFDIPTIGFVGFDAPGFAVSGAKSLESIESGIRERVPSAAVGEMVVKQYQRVNPFTAPITGATEVATFLTEKTFGVGSSEAIAAKGREDLVYSFTPLAGQYQTFYEHPAMTGVSLAAGVGFGVVGGTASKAYSFTRGAIAEKVISQGGKWRQAEQGLNFVATQGPRALGVLYAADVGYRATEGGTNLSPVSVITKTRGLVMQEAVPMGIGFGAGYTGSKAAISAVATTVRELPVTMSGQPGTTTRIIPTETPFTGKSFYEKATSQIPTFTQIKGKYIEWRTPATAMSSGSGKYVVAGRPAPNLGFTGGRSRPNPSLAKNAANMEFYSGRLKSRPSAPSQATGKLGYIMTKAQPENVGSITLTGMGGESGVTGFVAGSKVLSGKEFMPTQKPVSMADIVAKRSMREAKMEAPSIDITTKSGSGLAIAQKSAMAPQELVRQQMSAPRSQGMYQYQGRQRGYSESYEYEPVSRLPPGMDRPLPARQELITEFSPVSETRTRTGLMLMQEQRVFPISMLAMRQVPLQVPQSRTELASAQNTALGFASASANLNRNMIEQMQRPSLRNDEMLIPGLAITQKTSLLLVPALVNVPRMPGTPPTGTPRTPTPRTPRVPGTDIPFNPIPETPRTRIPDNPVLVPMGFLPPMFGGGTGSSSGYRRGRSWINVHAVGAERLVETRWSMPEFRMPKMKGFRF